MISYVYTVSHLSIYPSILSCIHSSKLIFPSCALKSASGASAEPPQTFCSQADNFSWRENTSGVPHTSMMADPASTDTATRKLQYAQIVRAHRPPPALMMQRADEP